MAIAFEICGLHFCRVEISWDFTLVHNHFHPAAVQAVHLFILKHFYLLARTHHVLKDTLGAWETGRIMTHLKDAWVEHAVAPPIDSKYQLEQG